MQVTKKIIAPLFIMVLLAGVAGVMSAREVSIRQSNKLNSISSGIGSESDTSIDSDITEQNKPADLIENLDVN